MSDHTVPIDREHDEPERRDDGLDLAPGDVFEDLFENAPCGYLETTYDGVITRVNRTFERWTGHTRESLLGTAFVDLLTTSGQLFYDCLLYTSPSPRDISGSRMPSSA